MKMSSYVVIYPNIVGISLGHKNGLEWTVVANGLSILAKNDACLLKDPVLISLLFLELSHRENSDDDDDDTHPGRIIYPRYCFLVGKALPIKCPLNQRKRGLSK